MPSIQETSMDATLQALFDAIIDGDRDAAKEKVNAAIAAKIDPETILKTGMIGAMTEVGRRFEEGEFFVPEMLIAARAMQEALVILKPKLVEAEVESAGRIVAGTVKGDRHDIGKNLVCMMLEGSGFEIVDLGIDVSPDSFVQAVKEHRPDMVAMSALLTTTMPNMRSTIEALNTAGVRDSVKVLVGGAPLTDDYARQIEADGFASDASKAVSLAKSMMAA